MDLESFSNRPGFTHMLKCRFITLVSVAIGIFDLGNPRILVVGHAWLLHATFVNIACRLQVMMRAIKQM